MSERRLVCDGFGRWWTAASVAIRAEVTAALAERLRDATGLGKLRLRLEIEREVRRRLKAIEPSREALY